MVWRFSPLTIAKSVTWSHSTNNLSS